MRKELKKLHMIRGTFTGIFVRFGNKTGYKGKIEQTLLFKDIKDKEGKIITSHLWFTMTKGFFKCDLQENDIIQFNARVKEYVKGYKGYRFDVDKPIEIDYKLSFPTKISKLTNKN